MAASIYPPGLPCPATSTVTAGERRLLSERMSQVRGIQRDRTYIETVTFPPMQAAECAQFDAWWRDDLIEGGAWFAAHWPLPQGLVTGVRRFIGTPQWEFVCLELWRVSATFEVRGETELPMIHGPVEPVPISNFLDTFTGAADTPLHSHTPDEAGEGFVYFDSKTGLNTDLQLDGMGHATIVPVGYGTAGVADSSASSPPFLMNLTLPYIVTLVGRPSDTLDNSVVLFRISTVNNSYIELRLHKDGPYFFSAAELFSNSTDAYFYESSNYSDHAAEHIVSIFVEETQATVTFDGVNSEPVALGGAPMLSFTKVGYLVDHDHPSDGSYISRAEVDSYGA